ncbi:hypothetical protein MIND_00465500 [Mycena indigotica]|uniref:Uncharacterized protein n=1 Tax=Mycena indigotica TaxID=2126181 RepID=A0A8H6W9L3_9AGAR|nr:uncharacterized protein MIND_00465500 [Mycena indigotica]KAF7306738.1 hypothetical protein MIND_00465500 [Mycena indigotica]
MSSPTPTFFSPQLVPRITPPPQFVIPDELVVEIATTIVIPDPHRFYHGRPSSESFYSALPDGTLATTAFLQDLRFSYTNLLVMAMIATLFIRNIIVCVDYLRRANLKRRTLLYLLLSSQILSLGLAPVIASFFYSSLKCTAVLFTAGAATGLASITLMSGVLGMKAYRCLDNSRVVLLVLVAFFGASSTLLIFHLANIQGMRRLSGGCTATDRNPQFIRSYVIVQLAHSFFLSCCFFFAVWKSRASPAARGRLSLRVTLDDFPSVKFDKPSRRFWLFGRGSTRNFSALDVASPTADAMSNKEQAANPRKSGFSRHDISDPIMEQPLVDSGRSTVSRGTSIFRFIPTMGLFHQVMKDELLYTTAITVTTFILALLVVLASKFPNCLDLSGWLSLNEVVISVLVIHSCGRVVRRNEKEALLQHPSSWWPDHRSPYARRGPFVTSPLRPGVPEDPFSDASAIRDSTSSWNSEFSRSPSSPTPAMSRDRRSSLPLPFNDLISQRGRSEARRPSVNSSLDEKRV